MNNDGDESLDADHFFMFVYSCNWNGCVGCINNKKSPSDSFVAEPCPYLQKKMLMMGVLLSNSVNGGRQTRLIENSCVDCAEKGFRYEWKNCLGAAVLMSRAKCSDMKTC